MIKNKNHLEILEGANIGAIDSEYDDEFLFDCFVHTPAFNSIADVRSPKSFVYGRTGAGKTAIIRFLEKSRNTVSIIDLKEVSIDYVANSDVIQYLTGLGVDLDILFQTLWKHILCLEYIKIRFGVNSERRSKNVFSKLQQYFSNDHTKKTAIEYLEKYSDKFWVDTDKHLLEIIESFESEVKANAGGEIEKFKTDAGFIRKMGREKKEQLQNRYKKFVNTKTLTELNRVMKLLKSYNGDSFKDNVFILVDKVDEHWVEEKIRYRLIGALIEAQRSFGKIEDLKIAIAIRADIFERVLQESLKPGTQREKFNDQISSIVWNEKQLKTLLNKRIGQLCKDKYQNNNVVFDDIFTHNVGREKPFDYIVARTQYRPRDVISFINEFLALAEGKHEITKSIIDEAEKKYSPIRVSALKNEWLSALPTVTILLELISARRFRFKVDEIFAKVEFDEFILRIYEDETNFPYDPVLKFVKTNIKNIESDEVKNKLKKVICSELYKIGAVSIKNLSFDRHHYSFKDAPIIEPVQINLDSKLEVHPAFHIGLNVYR